MITGIPEYSPPIEQGVRCTCLAYYVVYVGGPAAIGDAAGRARQRAEELRAHFIDSRVIPFITCFDCGRLLMFREDVIESAAVQ